MGANLSTLDNCKQQIKNKKPSSLLPKDRLREYLDYVTKTCVELELSPVALSKRFPNFSIDARLHSSEADELFGEANNNENPKANQEKTINGLRVACSIVLFSDEDFISKVTHLFRLFDFNEVHSLSVIDVELMIFLCLIASFRSFESLNDPAVPEINKFTVKYLQQSGRISLFDLLQALVGAAEVTQFCSILSLEQPVPNYLEELQRIRKFEDPSRDLPAFLHPTTRRKPFCYINSGEISKDFDPDSSSNPLNSLNRFLSESTTSKYYIKNFRLSLQWVYGFRHAEQIRSSVYHESINMSNGDFVSDSKVIYFAGNIVVLYYYKINKQKHYVEHRNRVCTIAVSKNQKFCATADMGAKPEIHIWCPNTLKSSRILPSVPHLEIYLLEFINRDKFIGVCLSRFDSPVLVYDIVSGDLLLTTYLPGFLLNLGTFIDTTSSFKFEDSSLDEFHGFDINNSFYGFTKTEIHFFLYNVKDQHYHHKVANSQTMVLNGAFIQSCCAAILNASSPHITFSEARGKFSIFVFCGLSNGVILYLKFPTKSDEDWKVISQVKLEHSINGIHFYQHSFVLVQEADTVINVMNVMSGEKVLRIDIKKMTLRLASGSRPSIRNMNLVGTKGLMITTKDGEMFYLSLKKCRLFGPQLNDYKPKIKVLDPIFALRDPLKALCIAENDQEGLLFVAGSNGILYVLSKDSRLLVQTIIVGESISALDCLSCCNGDFVIAIGTSSGKIKMITNWLESPRAFECDSAISFVKFSPKGLYLIAGSLNKNLYRFIFNQDSFFADNYLQIQLVEENPISLNFCLDFNIGVVETDLSNFHKVDIASFTLIKDVLNQNKMSLPRIHLRNVQNRSKACVPLIYDQELGFAIVGIQQGALLTYESSSHIRYNSGSFHFGHSGPIEKIVINNELSQLFTIANEDGCVFCWKIDLDIEESDAISMSSQFGSVVPPRNRNTNQFNLEVLSQNIDPSIDKFCESACYVQSYCDDIMKKRLQVERTEYEEKSNQNVSLKIRKVIGYETCSSRSSLFYINNSTGRQMNDEQCKRKTSDDEFDFIRKPKSPPLFTNAQYSETKGLFAHHSPNNEANKTQYCLNINTVTREMGYQSNNLSSNSKPINAISNGPNCSHPNNQLEQMALNASDRTARTVIYFVSRIAVIIHTHDPSAQQFYEAHSKKISVMAVYPSGSMVATGEAASSPKIHVWNARTRITLSVLRTYHCLGIKTLTFSTIGSLIISTSAGKFASIQVTDWLNNRFVAFRHSNGQQINDVTTSSLDACTFYTSSPDQICQWIVDGSSILLKKSFHIRSIDPSDSFVSLNFFTYELQNQVQKDVLALTSSGKVAVVRGSKSIHLHSLRIANPSMFKIVYLQQVPYFVITAYDLIIRFYGLDFSESLVIDLAESLKVSDVSSGGVYSLDIFEFRHNLSILVGLVNGQIFELNWHYEIDKRSKEIILLEQTHPKTVIHDEINDVIKDPNSNSQSYNRKILISAHPRKNILASVAPNRMLSIWNYKTDALMFSKSLSNPATVIKFLPCNTILLIGFIDGSLVAYGFGQKALMFQSVNPNMDKMELENEQVLFPANEMVPVNISAIILDSKLKIAVGYVQLATRDSVESTSDNCPIIRVLEFANQPYQNLSHSKISTKSAAIFGKGLAEQIIHIPSFKDTISTQLSVWTRFVFSSTFSKTGQHLYITSQFLDSDQNVNDEFNKQLSVVYDLESKTFLDNLNQVDDFRLQEPYICLQIKGLMVSLGLKDMPIPKLPNALDLFSFNTVYLPIFQEFEDNFIIGSTKGELLTTPQRKLFARLIQKDDTPNGAFSHKDPFKISYEKPDQRHAQINHSDEEGRWKEVWPQALRYVGHASMVTQIEVSSTKKYIYTTSTNDVCIIQWEIRTEPVNHLPRGLVLNQPDKFLQEVYPYEVFRKMTTTIYPQRLKLNSDMHDLDKSVRPIYRMEPFKIIGRKALTARSNVHLTLNNKLVYTTGCFVIALDLFEQRSENPQNMTTIVGYRFNSKEKHFNLGYHNPSSMLQLVLQKNDPKEPEEYACEPNESKHKTETHLIGIQRDEREIDLARRESRNVLPFSQSPHRNPFNKKFQPLLPIKGLETTITANAREYSNSIHIGNNDNTNKIKVRKGFNQDAGENDTNSNHGKVGNQKEGVVDEFGFSEITPKENSKQLLQAPQVESDLLLSKNRVSLTKQTEMSKESPYGLDLSKKQSWKGFETNTKNNGIKEIVVCGELHQELILPNSYCESETPFEVAMIEIAPDKFTACVALNANSCILGFWNIDSWTRKHQITLEFCVQVQMLRFSHDSQNLVCVGLTPNYTQTVFFIEASRAELLAFVQLHNCVAFKLKDIHFSLFNPFEFMSVGIDHIAKWKMVASLLQSEELDKEDLIFGDNPCVRSNRNNESKLRNEIQLHTEKSNISQNLVDTNLLVIRYLKRDLFLTASSKGCVYIWQDEHVVSSYVAYNSLPITCVLAGFNEQDFIVGSFSSQLVYFKMDSSCSKINTQLIEIVGLRKYETELQPQVEVQSLILAHKSKQLIVGTRDGSLVSIDINQYIDPKDDEDQEIIPQMTAPFQLCLEFFDNKVPKAANFSFDSKLIFVVSEDGYFFVYELSNLQLVFYEKPSKETNDIVVTEYLALLVCKETIYAFDVKNKFEFIKNFCTIANCTIIKAQVTPDYTKLIVLMQEQDDKKYKVETYWLKKRSIEKIDCLQIEEPKLLDISSDSRYMLIQSLTGQVHLYEIKESTRLITEETADIFSKQDWMQAGLVISPKCSLLRTYYTQENNIRSIVRIDDSCVAVGDDNGSVS